MERSKASVCGVCDKAIELVRADVIQEAPFRDGGTAEAAMLHAHVSIALASLPPRELVRRARLAFAEYRASPRGMHRHDLAAALAELGYDLSPAVTRRLPPHLQPIDPGHSREDPHGTTHLTGGCMHPKSSTKL